MHRRDGTTAYGLHTTQGLHARKGKEGGRMYTIEKGIQLHIYRFWSKKANSSCDCGR